MIPCIVSSLFNQKSDYYLFFYSKPNNNRSVAFSLMGDFMKKLPEEKMLSAIKHLLECGIEKGVIAKDYQLHGHRDQSCTDCPGDTFYTHLKKWPHFVSGPLSTYICRHP